MSQGRTTATRPIPAAGVWRVVCISNGRRRSHTRFGQQQTSRNQRWGRAIPDLLKAHAVQRVIDVRTIPRSRHSPQFNRDQLSPALHRARMHCTYIPGLGGLRRARGDSANRAWRNASFRGYADYMQTAAFEENLNRCIALARITSGVRARLHSLTQWARVTGTRVTYPAARLESGQSGAAQSG